jgi:hypothetical protein
MGVPLYPEVRTQAALERRAALTARMLPNNQYPIPQREPLIRIIRSPSTSGSKGKGQFCCQQYACAHQDNAEWVVGWHFEHRWLLFQKEPQARVRARLGPRARAWVRRTYARPPGRESIRKPVTLWRLDINVTGGGRARRHPRTMQLTVRLSALRVLSRPQARSSALPYEVTTSAPLGSWSLKRTIYIDEHSLRIRQSWRSLSLSARGT